MSFSPETPASSRRRMSLVRWMLGVYWLALFTASHWPRAPQLLPIDGGDKIVHFASYAILAVLLAWDRTLRGSEGLSTAWRNVLTLAVYGVCDELLQFPVPGRYCDAWDWLADISGASLGTFLFFALRGATKSELAEPTEAASQGETP